MKLPQDKLNLKEQSNFLNIIGCEVTLDLTGLGVTWELLRDETGRKACEHAALCQHHRELCSRLKAS